MSTFVWDGEQMVNKANGAPMLSAAQRDLPPQSPMVQEFKAYACPISGKDITDPSMHKANLKKHGCVEAKEVGGGLNGEIKNHNFAKRRGLTVSDKFMDQPSKSKGTAK